MFWLQGDSEQYGFFADLSYSAARALCEPAGKLFGETAHLCSCSRGLPRSLNQTRRSSFHWVALGVALTGVVFKPYWNFAWNKRIPYQPLGLLQISFTPCPFSNPRELMFKQNLNLGLCPVLWLSMSSCFLFFPILFHFASQGSRVFPCSSYTDPAPIQCKPCFPIILCSWLPGLETKNSTGMTYRNTLHSAVSSQLQLSFLASQETFGAICAAFCKNFYEKGWWSWGGKATGWWGNLFLEEEGFVTVCKAVVCHGS